MSNRPIPVSTANIMIQEYINFLKEQGIDPDKQSQSVSFDGTELMAWLNNVMPLADELKICLGVYPKLDANAGRITVILWPYNAGLPALQLVSEGKDGNPPEPIPPYNAGTLNP